MSVNEKMTAIADAIREKTGKAETLNLDEMAVGVGEVYEAGRGNVLAECFKTSVFGSGKRKLSVAIPFKPDVITIQTRDPYIRSLPNTFELFVGDLRSCAKYWATITYVRTGPSAANSAFGIGTTYNFATYENGVFSLDPNNSILADFEWSANVRYEISAARYPDKDAKALVEEQVALLPDVATGTGTVEYTQSRINEFFTAEEWASLIATKPNWTFSMI